MNGSQWHQMDHNDIVCTSKQHIITQFLYIKYCDTEITTRKHCGLLYVGLLVQWRQVQTSKTLTGLT